MNTTKWIELSEVGYCLLPSPYSDSTLQQLGNWSSKFQHASTAVRKNVFRHCTAIKTIFEDWEKRLCEAGLSCQRTNYCFYLSKTPANNWPLGFHQDTNFPDYLALSPKEKTRWLEKGFWVRLNLDYNDAYTGALKVIPASHQAGQTLLVDKEKTYFVTAKAGDVILFHPLLQHGSEKLYHPWQRRVLQCFFLRT